MNSPDERMKGLTAEASELFPVPERAVCGYLGVREAMAQFVDQELAREENVERLVGSARETMRSNHRHHVEFMASAFSLNAPDMLVRMLPWVYRAYRAHGFEYEYFPVELSAWHRAVGEYVDDPEPIQAIYEWMIDQHEEIIELSNYRGLGLIYESITLSHDSESLLGVLLRGDTGEFLDVVLERVKSTEDLAEFYVSVIQPVMYRVGELWERDEVSVAQEHLVTAIVSRGMSLACTRLDFPPITRGRALVACASKEFHELGARMVADLLEMDGWDVMFMGANLPRGDLVRFASQIKPHIVCISVTVPTQLLAAREMANAVREALTPSPRVMVGGQALSAGEDLCEKLGADACPASAVQAVHKARDWWEEISRQ